MANVPPPENNPPQPLFAPPPQYGQPHYGQPPQFGEYGQQSQYGQPIPPGFAPYPPEATPKKTLGLVAMIIAIAVLILAALASIVIGTAVGPIANRSGNSFSFNTATLTPEQARAFGATGILIVAQIALGSVAGIAAIVLGIIAAAKKRGRSFGVVAIIVAVVAPIVAFIVYIVSIAATLAPA
ncbi:hypothetical protein [Leifsonia poae]|uniref:hypothetical protein n=1 Tax=Leifsonia poae TaxID=110933 RepID=UPI001CBB9DE8|nr:hypothetical protein [Leifsonia poae]